MAEPVIAPVDESERPGGRLPEVTANVGAGVPVAVKLKLYAEPIAMGTESGAFVNAGGCCTVRASVAEPVPLTFVALTMTLQKPPEVGVPLIRPVEVFTLSPAGRPLAPKEVGLFKAVIW